MPASLTDLVRSAGKAARAKVEVEMLEADLEHRQAFARLQALMGPL
jgi:hypothetical protein